MTDFPYGADYYPEHWPEERWPEDARLMAEAGFNIVRLAEFAWSRLEPQEGVFDFTWLDRVIGLLSEQGILFLKKSFMVFPCIFNISVKRLHLIITFFYTRF